MLREIKPIFVQWIFCCIAGFAACHSVAATPRREPELKNASSHPIQYYLSLPDGWTAGKKWPVLVVIESADRQFSDAANEFARARKNCPFIIITPLVLTDGGSAYQGVTTYHYSKDVWDNVRDRGPFKFDTDGISAIMRDIVKDFGGEEKYFITGFEAGGHTAWGIVFNHPEQLRGAVLVCPNYQGRWVDEQHISTTPERSSLAIRVLVGSKDEIGSTDRPIFAQMKRAMELAEARGYKNVSLVRVEGKGHERLSGEVIDYFSSLIQR